MKTTITPLAIPEVRLVEVEAFRDERGFFIESYNKRTFAEQGFDHVFVQDNHSRSAKGVLRGFHYQNLDAPMGKLVRCTAGAILDVAIDLRMGSPTFGRAVSAELSAENMHQLYVPVGFGHAFYTLSESAEVLYKCTGLYAPESEGSIRWDDPDVGFEWPTREVTISKKDEAAPSLADYLESPAFRYGEC